MRFVSVVRGDRTIPGILEDGVVRTIACPSLRDYIALPAKQRERHHSDELIDSSHARLAAPLLPPRNVFCVGRNYLEHAKESFAASGREVRLLDVPVFFTKATSAIAPPDADLLLPAAVSQEFDFEAELAVVIGTTCKDVGEADALEVIFGYMCLNDVTARDVQRAHGQWFKGKSLDNSCPIGPWIVSADAVADPAALGIAFRLNGETLQQSTTANMIFGIPRLIADLSRGMTLLPGDVLSTGTPEGVGFARTPPRFLRDGDLMEVDIERIGVLRNRVRIV